MTDQKELINLDFSSYDIYRCCPEVCSDNGCGCILLIQKGFTPPEDCTNPSEFDNVDPCEWELISLETFLETFYDYSAGQDSSSPMILTRGNSDSFLCCNDIHTDIAKRSANRTTIELLTELREHLFKRKTSFEKNYPVGHDQRDGAMTRISEINQMLLTLDAIESLHTQ
jgi:hypothetical protein